MLLAIDIGNTNITFGIFDKDVLIKNFRTPSNSNVEKYQDFLIKETQNFRIKHCIIASVKDNYDKIFKSIINKLFGIQSIIVSGNLNLKFKLKTNHPKTVGADRIANAAAVQKRYPLPAIVVDMGTATTFDIVDKNGDFIGGIITPGLKLQLDALNIGTSKLPLAKISKVKKAIGTNTLENILSGVILGHVCLVKGLVKECSKELDGNPSVIITGGYSHIMSDYFHSEYINPNLTLEGLKMIYESL